VLGCFHGWSIFCRNLATLICPASSRRLLHALGADTKAVLHHPPVGPCNGNHTIVNGSPVFFRVKSVTHLKPCQEMAEHDSPLLLIPKQKLECHRGVPLNVKPGVYTLLLSGITVGGKDVSFQRHVTIRAGKIPQHSYHCGKQIHRPARAIGRHQS